MAGESRWRQVKMTPAPSPESDGHKPGSTASPAPFTSALQAPQHRPECGGFRGLHQKASGPGQRAPAGGYPAAASPRSGTGMGMVPRSNAGAAAVSNEIGSGLKLPALVSQNPQLRPGPPLASLPSTSRSVPTGSMASVAGSETISPPVDRPWRGPGEPGAAEGSNATRLDAVLSESFSSIHGPACPTATQNGSRRLGKRTRSPMVACQPVEAMPSFQAAGGFRRRRV